MKEITKYAAFDGKEFDSAAACRRYEAENAFGLLVGLTADQVVAALNRTPTEAIPNALDLADAIENVAKKIIEKRLSAGDFRRKPKADAPPAQTDEPPAPPAEAAE